jgi:hypothetical protein
MQIQEETALLHNISVYNENHDMSEGNKQLKLNNSLKCHSFHRFFQMPGMF